MALLEMKNLNVAYNTGEKRVLAVRNVSLLVEERDSVGIVGESGSGKSTLAMAVLRLLPARIAEVSGHVLFRGRDLLGLDETELGAIRWKEIAAVLQKSMNSLSPVHKIGFQMKDVYRVHEPQATREEVKGRMLGLLNAVSLPERIYDSYPHELSGGMMQRVAIALSLMHNPKLLILDEATTALDMITKGQILESIMGLQERLKVTWIMVSHDISAVAATCKKIAVMYAGSLVETGLTEDVLAEPLHPYTQGLIESYPAFGEEEKGIQGIPGHPPDPSALPRGCPFAPRCSFAHDMCRNQEPEPLALDGGRRVACHLRKGGAKTA